jgi:adenylate cyclase
VLFGLFITLLAFLLRILPFGTYLEESIGLNLLFQMRGTRGPPSDVVVISIDKASADAMKLPDDPDKWPRSLHARLIDHLQQKGAALIVFDLFFNEPGSSQEDSNLADSIRKARNVILCACLDVQNSYLTDQGGRSRGDMTVITVLPPHQQFAESAIETAPFPLPKVPRTLYQYWTFKTLAGDMPTLPVVAHQIFSMDVYDEFLDLLQRANPSHAVRLPQDKEEIMQSKNVRQVIGSIRDIFLNHQNIPDRMYADLKERNVDPKRHHMIESLIRMYQSPESQYLNFYGPPHTIPTIQYYEMFQPHNISSENNEQIPLKGKAVFIGLSAQTVTEQNEGFYTVFSKDGLDISGVEIAATAFANLLEDMPVRPTDLHLYLFIIVCWGVAIGVICRQLPIWGAVLLIGGLSGIYLFAALYQFKTTARWYPIAIPLFFQVPVTLLGSIILKYKEVIRERQRIQKAFEHYLPKNVVAKLSRDVSHIKTAGQFVYGICLFTDIKDYTTMSEKMDPRELGDFLNEYYETVFEPIKKHNGYISNVIGDSLVALWVAVNPDAVLKHQACEAALDVVKTLNQFNEISLHSNKQQLYIRISLHSGYILLENIGAFDHYEYRPIGDMVNTASRIDGLNKHLGTQILLTQSMIDKNDGFLTREVGTFLLVGKSDPVSVHELVCGLQDCTDQQKRACERFPHALALFRKQLWDEAAREFQAFIERFGPDGPSIFYAKICSQYKENPPGAMWDGTVKMTEK